MGGFKLINVAPGTLSTDAATLANLQAGAGNYVATVGGTADVITLTPSPAITAYAAGQTFEWIASGTNTTNVTVNVSGLGAKALTKNGATALAANDIISGEIICAEYDGTQFQLKRSGAAGLASNTFTGNQTIIGNATLTSTDTGATAAPSIDLYRNSANPAAADLIGQHVFSGEDSAGNTQTYATVTGEIVDPTSTAEDGELVIATVVAGTIADRLHVGAGVYTDTATGGDQGAGTVNATAVYDDGVQLRPAVMGTAQASTSGTAITFTGIPSWATQIAINFNGVSTDNTSAIIIQIGDSGGIENSGYLGSGGTVINGSSSGVANYTVGFGIGSGTSAAALWYGTGTLTLVDAASNTWAWSANYGRSDAANNGVAGGAKALSATLTQLTITQNGAGNFDAGQINIRYS